MSAPPGIAAHGDPGTWIRTHWKTAVLLGTVAVVLSLPALGWGLPDGSAPDRVWAWGNDELAPLGPLGEVYSVFLARGPRHFNPQYPLLQYMIDVVFAAPYLIWLKLVGGMGRMVAEYPFGFTDPPAALRALTVWQRLPSVLAGSGVVALAFITAGRWRGITAGIIAALGIALTYPMVYYTGMSNVDVPALLWTAAGLLVFAEILRTGLTRRRAALFGLFAALATATKDPGYAAFAGMGGALAILPLVGSRRETWWDTAGAAGVGVAVALVVYAVASGLVFSPSRYVEHVRFITHGSSGSPLYFKGTPTLATYLGTAWDTMTDIRRSLGWPVSLIAFGGVLLAVRSRREELWFLLPGLGILVGVILPVRFVLIRFVLVMAYIGTLYAAFAAARGWDHADRRVRVAVRAGVSVALMWSAVRAGDLAWQMHGDRREPLGEWLCQHAGPRGTVGYYGAARKLPRLPCGITTVRLHDPDGVGVVPAGVNRPDYVLMIPQQHFESWHEFVLPDTTAGRLLDGTAGYRLAFASQAPSLFRDRPIPFVNPPVRAFARTDLADRLNPAVLRLELADPREVP